MSSLEREIMTISLVQYLMSNLDYERMSQEDADKIDDLAEALGFN